MIGRRRSPNLDRLSRRGNARRLAQVARRSDVVEGTRGELIDMAANQRRDALLALAELGPEPFADAEVLDAAIAGVVDPSEEVAVAAVRALAVADSPDARAALTAAAGDGLVRRGHAQARRDAVEVLGRDGERGVSNLVRRLLDRSIELPLTDEDADAVRLALEAATGSTAPTTGLLDDLIEQLHRPDETGRGRAEEVLRWFGPDAVDALTRALEDPETRRGAAGAIGATHDANVIPALKRCLDDDDAETRRRAGAALGEIVSPLAVEPLLGATGDDDYRVRAQAVESLDRLGTVGVVVGIETIARRGAPRIEPPPYDDEPAVLEPPAEDRQTERRPPERRPRPTVVPAVEPEEQERVRTIARERFRDNRPLWPGLRAVLQRATATDPDSPVNGQRGGTEQAG